MKALGTVGGYHQALAGLYARSVIEGHHVGLHYQHHVGLEGEVGDRLVGPTTRAEHRSQVTAAVPVNEVIKGGESGRFNYFTRRH